jgi:hypothetical protein
MDPRDPVALGFGAAEALRRGFASLARNAAFSAVLALPMTFILHAGYGSAFLFVLAASTALEFGRSILRRSARARP